jgi:hypothetical protein
MLKKKLVRRRATKKKSKPPLAKTAIRARKPVRSRRAARGKTRRKIPTKKGRASPAGSIIALQQRGLGAEAAGQSGDIEGLARVARANSESVEELSEEGQSFEAGVVAGVEEAQNADESEVITHEVLEDDVPSEYEGER